MQKWAFFGNIRPVFRFGQLRGALTPALSQWARGQEGAFGLDTVRFNYRGRVVRIIGAG